MSDTDKDSASIVEFPRIRLDAPAATSVTHGYSPSGEQDLPRWLTPRGWAAAMGLPHGAAE